MFRLLGLALVGLLVIAVLFVVRTSLEARAVSEGPPLTAANAAEEDAPPLAKADKLPPPDFVVRMPVVPVEPTRTSGNTQVSKTDVSKADVSKADISKAGVSKAEVSRTEVSRTEEVRTWHWRAGSTKIHKSTSVRERDR